MCRSGWHWIRPGSADPGTKTVLVGIVSGTTTPVRLMVTSIGHLDRIDQYLARDDNALPIILGDSHIRGDTGDRVLTIHIRLSRSIWIYAGQGGILGDSCHVGHHFPLGRY